MKVYNYEGKITQKYKQEEVRLLVRKKKAYWVSPTKVQLTVKDSEILKNEAIDKSVKRAIIKREDRVCYICNKRIPEHEKATVDHLISRHNGGTNDESNLRCCCMKCNNDKSSLDLKEYVDKMKNNRSKYNNISNSHILTLENICKQVMVNIPKITLNNYNNSLKLSINNKGIVKITKEDSMKSIAVKFSKVLNELNKNYIVEIGD